jgi:hypothetical protein
MEPGQKLGGKSLKFLCLADDSQTLLLKYWDRELESGNREVFAAVAAARLIWALGFGTIPVMPVELRCRGCPANPMTGKGAVGDRRYVALMTGQLSKPLNVTKRDSHQGWSWRELHDAIEALPAGDEKVRQRTHLDALTLLGVLIQHGDRKPEQHALYCDAQVAPEAGVVTAVDDETSDAVLTEHKGTAACTNPAVAVVDIGSTFGGAGRLSKKGTAKMNIKEWATKSVFKASGGTACRGNLTVSLTAGDEGRPDPPISEEGRRFLVEQLHRLTPDHLHALFMAARVDQMKDDVRDGAEADPVQAWIDAFQDKVRQIESRRCDSLAS